MAVWLCRRQEWTDVYLVLTGAIISFYKNEAAARKVMQLSLKIALSFHFATMSVTV